MINAATQENPKSGAEWLITVPPELPVLIAGPTASGKSALALELAQAQGRVVVNADALQVYSCWRVLSARPSPDDEARAPHLLYGTVAPGEPWSVGHWLRALEAILERDPRPVIVGGSGLYFAALTEGLVAMPPTPPRVRAAAMALEAAEGLAGLLGGIDPETASRLDRSNPARVRRAFEVQASTGRGLADWQRSTGPALLPPTACLRLVLSPEPDWLDARIATRFSTMIEAGALDEVRAVRAFWRPTEPWAQAHGARDLMGYIDGRTGLSEAVAAATRITRQYAKRQRTWARNRMSDWQVLRLP